MFTYTQAESHPATPSYEARALFNFYYILYRIFDTVRQYIVPTHLHSTTPTHVQFLGMRLIPRARHCEVALYSNCQMHPPTGPHAYSNSSSALTVDTTTPLAHVVVSPIATCTCGVFVTTHWHKYHTYARQLTQWWWWW